MSNAYARKMSMGEKAMHKAAELAGTANQGLEPWDQHVQTETYIRDLLERAEGIADNTSGQLETGSVIRYIEPFDTGSPKSYAALVLMNIPASETRPERFVVCYSRFGAIHYTTVPL